MPIFAVTNADGVHFDFTVFSFVLNLRRRANFYVCICVCARARA
jgi:hypothetical protein